MPQKKKSRSLKFKLLTMIFFGIIITAVVLLGGYFFSINGIRIASEKAYNRIIVDEVKNRLRFIVETTVNSIQDKYKGQVIEETDAIQLIKIELENVRYGENGSFFAYRYDGVQLVAHKMNVGLNLCDMTDRDGKKPIQEAIATAKTGGGFVSYTWLNPDTQRQEKIMSYIVPLRIGETEVLIGTDEYLTTFESVRQEVGNIFNRDQAQKTFLALVIGIVTIVLVLTLIYLYISIQISRPINSVVKNIRQIATGDFTGLVRVSNKDEIGEMARELSEMGKNLAEIITQVLYSAAQVEETSEEIAVGNQDLSRRTQEQASTLEEVAATIEEVNSSIQLTTSNSEQANLLSHSTLEAVNAGQESVHETLKAMEQISTSSQKIGDIMRVVNDIAFQTNLLALNAAVEAARAGDHGRGFAVVAAEVRNLAGRTSELSKEVESLIKESAERVERGNFLVRQSAELLNQIVENTKKTVAEINNVASTMKEQATAGEQIQVSIDQLNQVTQQNAAMVEEMAASSMMLSNESENLTRIINRFQVSQKLPEKKVSSQPVETMIPEPKPAPAVQKEFVGDSWEKF